MRRALLLLASGGGVVAPTVRASGAAYNSNLTTLAVTVPASAQAGDLALAVVTHNTTVSISTDLTAAGWTLVDSFTDGTIGCRLYSRAVTASGAGSPGNSATVTFSAINKACSAVVAVANGTIDVYGHAAEAGTDTSRETPALTATAAGIVVDFAMCKGSSPVGVTAPSARTALAAASGTGGGTTEIGTGWAPVSAAGSVASVSYTSQSVSDGGTISVAVKAP